MNAVVLSIFQTVAVNLVPLSLIAPFAGLTTLWSVLFAGTGLFGIREEVSCVDTISFALVIGGIVLMAASRASSPLPETSVQELSNFIASAPFLAWWLVIISLCQIVPRVMRRKDGSHRLPPTVAVVVLASLGASTAACSQSFLKFIAMSVPAYLLGAPGVQLHVLVGSIVGIAMTAPHTLWILGKTLAAGMVVLAVPTYEALCILTTAGVGILFWNDLANYSPGALTALALGLGLTMCGVVLLNVSHHGRVEHPSREAVLRAEEVAPVIPHDGPSTVSTPAKGLFSGRSVPEV